MAYIPVLLVLTWAGFHYASTQISHAYGVHIIGDTLFESLFQVSGCFGEKFQFDHKLLNQGFEIYKLKYALNSMVAMVDPMEYTFYSTLVTYLLGNKVSVSRIYVTYYTGYSIYWLENFTKVATGGYYTGYSIYRFENFTTGGTSEAEDVYSSGAPDLTPEITFPTQESLYVVDPDLLGTAKDNVDDPIGCGSYLFKAKSDGDTRAISLNILIENFKSSDSLFFRVHPIFLKCIQAAMTNLMNDGTQVELVTGFLTKNDVGNSPTDEQLYYRSGCGVKLQFKSGVTGNVDDIIKAVLKTCPIPMMKIQRDIGISKPSSTSVHVHMKGANDTTGPTFSGISANDALTEISASLDPQKVPDCSSVKTVANGDYYPSGFSDPAQVVGTVDVTINRSMTTDYNRLVQYLGNNIDFPSCTQYSGNSVDKRCNIRTMTTRMYNMVSYLQKIVIDNMCDKLQITEAFDDDGNSNDLRSEGRKLKVRLMTDNSATKLATLSQYAICAGVDYVAHEGTSLLLAVKKMKGEKANAIQFKTIQLMSVEPPSPKASYYSLPNDGTDFTQTEIDSKYSLFDSNGREDIKLNENATVRMFMSNDPEYRYFRLDPRIVQCYSDIVYNTNKNLDYNDQVEVEVVRGYLSNPEQAAIMDQGDDRLETHTLGSAMQIRYKNGTSSAYTALTLAQKAVEQCSPTFDNDEESMGVGVYKDSIFVDVKETFKVWVESNDVLPTGMTLLQYENFIEERSKLANKFRIVDPDDLTEACSLAHPPKKQSIAYEYVGPEMSKRKRATADTCVPTNSTAFCLQTLEYRKQEEDNIWNETKRKHLFRDPDHVKDALEGCFGICGTCLEGNIFDLKVKHCSNLIHWLPFELMNDADDITNFYSRDNMDMRGHACNGGGHCLEKSPLFCLLMPSIERRFRPDPTKNVEELIYAYEENPSPVLPLLDEMYGINAKGIVSFWAADETDIGSMKKQLQTTMLYNKDVKKVNIYVQQEIAKKPVDSKVKAFVKEFVTTGCLHIPEIQSQTLRFCPFRIPSLRELHLTN